MLNKKTSETSFLKTQMFILHLLHAHHRYRPISSTIPIKGEITPCK